MTLDRDAGFGLGFMTPLSSHFFGERPSERRVRPCRARVERASGWPTPRRDVVIAVLFNAGLDADTALSFRRVHLVDAIYRALDAATV